MRKFLELLKLLRRRLYRAGLRHGAAAAIEHEHFLRSVPFATLLDARIISFQPLDGPAAIFDRILLFGRKSDYSLAEMREAAFERPVERVTARQASRNAFEIRPLRERISRHFFIEREIASPLALLRRANSQVFPICRKKASKKDGSSRPRPGPAARDRGSHLPAGHSPATAYGTPRN